MSREEGWQSWREEGRRAWERCEVESKPPSSPGLSVKDSAEKIDNMCPLCRGMPKTMTSSSSKLARTRGERPGLTHGSFIHYYSLSYSSFFLALRLSLCTDSDNDNVFIFKNLKNKIVLFLLHTVRQLDSLHTSIKNRFSYVDIHM